MGPLLQLQQELIFQVHAHVSKILTKLQTLLNTEPHSPPSSIDFETDSSTEVTISWQPPPFEDRNGPITYYSLILTELVFGLEKSYVNVTSLSYTFTGLEEYNNYSFIIAAATEKGLGPYSSVYRFTTEEDSEL